MSLLRYVSHAEVVIDPETPVPRWGLSDVGLRRVEAMLAQRWLATVDRLIASDETKAIETASIIGAAIDVEVEVRPDTGEVDRSATGFVPGERHEQLADRLFGRPDESADGWERAVDAQARVLAGLADVLDDDSGTGDALVVGHGGVGTLLYCALADLPIERRHDQPGQGHYWSYDRFARRVLHPWLPVDDLA